MAMLRQRRRREGSQPVPRSAQRRARPGGPPMEPDRRPIRMSDPCTGLKLGQIVPDFELATYDPLKGDFGKFSLKDQIARKRWSILILLPRGLHIRLSDRVRCSGRAARAVRADGL